MIWSQKARVIPLTVTGQTFATNSDTRLTIDRFDSGEMADYATIVVQGGSSSSSKLTTLQIQHSDTTDATNFATISGFSGTTNSTASTSEFVIPAGATATDDIGAAHVFNVDCKNLKRYLGVLVRTPNTTGTGEMVNAFASP